jgi:L-ascorbate metabolism protein UlaG (beta-lactamase superfamily)
LLIADGVLSRRIARVEITLLGHSCFRLRGRDVTLITDPFVPAEGSLRIGADIVTVSHDQEGHNGVGAVDGTPRVVTGPGEYEIKGVLITGVGTFHDAEHGRARGRNTVYLIEMDDLRVCHLGDLGHELSTEQIEEIGTVDVLLVPAGGPHVINSAQVAEVIGQLEPCIVVPMDWTEAGDGRPTGALDKFCHEMGIKEVEPQPRLNVSKTSLPSETQVVVLEPRR